MLAQMAARTLQRPDAAQAQPTAAAAALNNVPQALETNGESNASPTELALEGELARKILSWFERTALSEVVC